MSGENFVYFFTIQGFFVGIIFGVLKSFDAEGLLLYTFSITTFFYLFSYVITALYFKTIKTKPYFFPKDIYEHNLDFFVKEINKREKLIKSTYKIADATIKMNTNDVPGKKG